MKLLVKGLLAAALAAFAAPALAAPPPFVAVPDTSTVGPALPQGQLRPVSLSPDEGIAYFLIEEAVRRRGDLIDYWSLMVLDPAQTLKEGTVQLALLHIEVNCQARTTRRLFLAAYGESGASIATDNTPDAQPEALEADSAAYLDAQVLCDGDDTVKSRMTGYAEALAATREALAEERAAKPGRGKAAQ